MSCEEDDDFVIDPAVAAHVRTLNEAGLFLDLDDKRLRRLLRLGAEGELNIDGQQLRSVIEAHLRQPHEDITLSAPQSVEAFTEEIDVDVSEVLSADPDRQIVHLIGSQYAIAFDDEANAEAYGGTVMLKPETHHEWVACYNAALSAIGDDRQFVSFDVEDFEEPIYVLGNPAQRTALAAAELLAYDTDEIELPGGIWDDTRAEELAKSLTSKRVPARADGTNVVLDLDLASATALLERLRAEIHHDQRVGVLVAQLYVAAVRP